MFLIAHVAADAARQVGIATLRACRGAGKQQASSLRDTIEDCKGQTLPRSEETARNVKAAGEEGECESRRGTGLKRQLADCLRNYPSPALWHV